MKDSFPCEKFEDSESEQEFVTMMRLGQAHLDDDNLAALIIFQKMMECWPQSTTAWLMMGAVNFTLSRFNVAVEYFQRSVQLAPSNEMVSRGLFIAAWRAEQYELAYIELERFVQVAGIYSKRYDLLLADLRGEIDAEEFDRRIASIIEEEL